MAFDRQTYDEAMKELSRRRERALTEAAAFHDRLIKEVPRLAEIEQGMAASSGKVVKAILDGTAIEATVERIKAENLSLQVEMAMLLEEHGETVKDFSPRYTCPHCEDTGFVSGRPCTCLQALLREISCRRLSELSAMRPMRFEDFDLSYYSDIPDDTGISPRARMREVLGYCRCYADDFDGRDSSLLLYGPTGVGKTHLSLAIAGRVIEKGYSVVYGPAQKLLHRLEKEHFGKENGDSEDVMTVCDLLILDDVGTEFSSAFYQSALYNLINSRMLDTKPTIISTNLSAAELEHRYGEAITSRITGTFQPLVCTGGDIRREKLRRSLNEE